MGQDIVPHLLTHILAMAIFRFDSFELSNGNIFMGGKKRADWPVTSFEKEYTLTRNEKLHADALPWLL